MTRYRFGVAALSLGLLLLTGCASPARETATPAATPIVLRVGASDVGESLARDLADGYRAVRSDVVILVGASGSADSVLAIQADRGATSAAFRTPLGGVTLVPAVASGFPAPGLSVGQLAALLTGEIVDWSQVGGPAGAVVVVSRDSASEGATLAAERLGVSGLVADARLVPDWAAARQTIAQTPGAIGILPAAEVDATLRAVQTDMALTVGVEAQAAQSPTGAAYDFLAWAQSPAGQAVVDRRHDPLP